MKFEDSNSGPESFGQTGSAQPGKRPVVSYLVRYWLEPDEGEADASQFRGYVRDLETGTERYFGDPTRFAEHVQRRLRSARQVQTLDALGGIAAGVG